MCKQGLSPGAFYSSPICLLRLASVASTVSGAAGARFLLGFAGAFSPSGFEEVFLDLLLGAGFSSGTGSSLAAGFSSGTGFSSTTGMTSATGFSSVTDFSSAAGIFSVV